MTNATKKTCRGAVFMIQMTRREQVGALVLAAMLVSGLAIRVLLAPTPPDPVVILAPDSQEGEAAAEPKEILVHVAGAVARPGVYRLSEGARVFEALEAAGGALPQAEPHALNLAEPLYDGRRVRVPLAGEVDGGAAVMEAKKVNVNTAAAGELESLPGIGPAKAAAIVKHREQRGPFRAEDDLAAVPGIGQKTVENLKEYITLY